LDLQRNSLNQPFTRDRYPTAVRDHFLAILANPPAPTPARKKAATRHATRPAVAEWTIEPCTKVHERSEFSCGKPPLDDCIRSRMSQHEKERLGKTFVAPVLNQSKRTPHERRKIPDNLARLIWTIDFTPTELAALGGEWKRIGEEVSKELDHKPPTSLVSIHPDQTPANPQDHCITCLHHALVQKNRWKVL
jgi:hypothetical protein